MSWRRERTSGELDIGLVQKLGTKLFIATKYKIVSGKSNRQPERTAKRKPLGLPVEPWSSVSRCRDQPAEGHPARAAELR